MIAIHEISRNLQSWISWAMRLALKARRSGCTAFRSIAFANWVGQLWLKWIHPLNGLVAIALIALVVVPFGTDPLFWMPSTERINTYLGVLLTAQAAITAFALAVSLFVLQNVRNREDSDENVYAEYVRRSMVRRILWVSVILVGVTCVVYAGGFVAQDESTIINAAPGFRNLALLGTAAFLANLALVLFLFERALKLSRPDHWLELRHDMFKRDVSTAVNDYLQQVRREGDHIGTGVLGNSPYVLGSANGSANEAVQTLLGDARRAMDARRLAEFKKSIALLKGVLSQAMDEMERAGHPWSNPGSHAQWPPLRELNQNLYRFREAVIRWGETEYLLELLFLDYWFGSTGARRDCGELFALAAEGYRSNYEIARRIGRNEFLETFRDRLWHVADGMLSGTPPKVSGPCARYLLQIQERMLSDELKADRFAEFAELHEGFLRFLNTYDRRRTRNLIPYSESACGHGVLEEEYRVVLMGLGGRAAILANSGDINHAHPYIELCRSRFAGQRTLGDSLARALSRIENQGMTIWNDWEMEGARSGETRSVHPDRYPLAFFTVQLLESVTVQLVLNLHGFGDKAKRWFEENSSQFERHVTAGDPDWLDSRREAANCALQRAVVQDRIDEDTRILSWEISSERAAAFCTQVLDSHLATDSVSQLFDKSGLLDSIPMRSCAPNLVNLGDRFLLPKSHFARAPSDHRTHYAPIDGIPLGKRLSDRVLQLLCDQLGELQVDVENLDTPGELLQSIRNCLEQLDPGGEVLVILDGDWSEILFELGRGQFEEFNQSTQLTPGAPRIGIGRYRGHTLVPNWGPGQRQIIVVDIGAWGRLERKQAAAGNHVEVLISPVTEIRAQELLDENPTHFPEESDVASKLRRLQTQVQVEIDLCIRFCVIDGSRAHRVVDS